MKNKYSSILLAIAVLFVMGLGLSGIQSQLNSIRYEKELTDTEPLENAPPMLAFTTVALGGFRGLLADYLWLRSTKMQEEGNYFEMVQLASWIVKLQPRYTPSTAFLAWNMAYNVSVTFTRFEDRWRWVKRGIELIRDEALERNPADPALFQQLGWIYQHKMGQDLDDANKFYKDEFAKEMIRLFGPYYGQWELIAKAPDNEAKLKASLGEAKFKTYSALLAKHAVESFDALEDAFRIHAAIMPRELRQDMRDAGIAEMVELCLRTRWIVRKYRLDPIWIMRLNRKHGEFDWRLPEAHAIYWAERGKDRWTSSRDNDAKFKQLQCERMVFQSLQNAFVSGKLVYIANKDDDLMYENIQHIEIKPNLELAEAANSAYREALDQFGVETIGGAYMNFLSRAITQLYINGRLKEARRFMALGNEVKNPDGSKRYGTKFEADLKDFARKELADTLVAPSNKDASAIVRALLFQAFLEYSLGSDEQNTVGDNYLIEAKRAYFNYRTFIKGTELRRDIAPWQQVVLNTLSETLLLLERPAAIPKTPEEFQAILNSLKSPRAIILRERFNSELAMKQLFIPPAEDIKESEIK